MPGSVLDLLLLCKKNFEMSMDFLEIFKNASLTSQKFCEAAVSEVFPKCPTNTKCPCSHPLHPWGQELAVT